MSHRFKSELVEVDDLSYKFVFKLEEGEANAGLMNVVFDEYINNPFLVSIKGGRSFIAVGESPLLDRTVNTEVIRNGDVIEYKLVSQLFKNKFVEASEIGKENNTLYMELSTGNAIRLKNASSKNLGQIMFLLVVIEILNGMRVEVDIEEYIPRCDNCVFKEENLKLYSGTFVSNVKEYIEEKTGCIVDSSKYGETEEVDCPFFIRDTNPDLQDMDRVLVDLTEAARVADNNGNITDD